VSTRRVWIATCGALLAALIAATTLLVYERGRTAELEAARAGLCRRQFLEIESLSKEVTSHGLRARVRYGFLDQGVSKMCTGSELPVSTRDADACWIKSGDDGCYREVLAQLLAIYSRRWR
jgi:hypothetical protein